MDWVIIMGCTCLGLLIGGLVCYFVAEQKQFGLRDLSGAVSILAGAGVIAIFHLLGGSTSVREYWFYPLGLLIGFIVIASQYFQARKQASRVQ